MISSSTETRASKLSSSFIKFLAIAGCLSGPLAHAQVNLDKRFGIGAGFGLAMPVQTRSWLDNTGHGWALSGEANYHYSPNMAAELGFNHVSMTTKGKTIGQLFTLGWNYDFCQESMWHPYFGLGVGYAQTHESVNSAFNAKNWGALGKLGVNYFVTDGLAVGLVAKYLWFQSNVDTKYNVEPVTAQVTLSYFFPSKEGKAEPETHPAAKVDPQPDDRVAAAETVKPQFEFAKSVLKPEYHSDLDDLAARARASDSVNIQVDGHTDSVGSEAYNQKLSVARALAVKHYLIQQRVPAARVMTRGYGESKPIATNDTEEGRAQNRRVEAYLRDKEAKIRLGSRE